MSTTRNLQQTQDNKTKPYRVILFKCFTQLPVTDEHVSLVLQQQCFLQLFRNQSIYRMDITNQLHTHWRENAGGRAYLSCPVRPLPKTMPLCFVFRVEDVDRFSVQVRLEQKE
jgi:hypothetical protein